MKKFLFFSPLLSFLAIATLSTPNLAHAQESFPEIHNQPIKIHLLDAEDGSPKANLRVILVAGYNQDDLRKGLWREETATDSDGDLKLPRAMLNLPWMQVIVAQGKLCIYKQPAPGLSVERIREEGLSAPNPCGLAAVTEKPGELNFFVRKLPPVKKRSKFAFFKYRIRLVNSETEIASDEHPGEHSATVAESTKPAIVAEK
jgi:hypothetical protein